RLVAVAREERPALASGGDRLDPPVLATVALLDADHIRAHVAEDGAAPRCGDEAAVVEDADSREHLGHAEVGTPSSSRSAGRSTLPDGVRGRASTIDSSTGTSYRASDADACSSSSGGVAVVPGRSPTAA